MLTYEQRQLVDSYYDFASFAQTTGLKAPVVAPAWNDFREFTWGLMKKNQSYNMDGIITEAFEQWLEQQKVYQVN